MREGFPLQSLTLLQKGFIFQILNKSTSEEWAGLSKRDAVVPLCGRNRLDLIFCFFFIKEKESGKTFTSEFDDLTEYAPFL